MVSFWEFYNFKYMNKGELEKTEESSYDDDCEILIEFDDELFGCEIADVEEYDGKLVLKVRRW